VRTARRALLIATMLASPGVTHAAEVVGATLGVSLGISSEASTASSHEAGGNKVANSEQRAGLKQGTDGMSCTDHNDCRGWCEDGACAGGSRVKPQCETDQDCHDDLVCREGWCTLPPQPPVERSAPPVPGAVCRTDDECVSPGQCRSGQCVIPQAPPRQDACTSDAQCGPGMVCEAGQCAPPPSPPMLRRGRELFLRERVVQLRQDLAFGAGPVITMLASVHQVSPVALGRTLRAHRAELAGLIGDGADASWADRFLRRVEELRRECPAA
jgi:hypothetical protein